MKVLINLLLPLVITACAGVPNLSLEQKKSIPSTVEKPFQQGLARMRAKEYRAAERLFKRVVSVDKTLPGAYLNLAIVQTHLGKDSAAMVAVETLLALDEKHVAGLNQQGLLLRRRGDFEAAKLVYEKALEIEPKYVLARLNLGVLCDLYLNQPVCALQAYRQFQQQNGIEDKQVAGWIVELERRK
ncbi:MAG: tetratricopeptide repeat protein [Gammaproteobacteria bacterium]|nr:tetratricopeptide repeat protein [Gammaproteobacteria bacterium]